MFVWTIPRSACYHSSCLAVVPFPICSSTAESVVAQYGSSLKNDHFEYIRYVQYLDSAGNPLYFLQLVGVQREAGEVTYFSHGYQCAWWSNRSNPADYYSWNTSAGNTWGTLLALGSALGTAGHGVFEMVSDLQGQEPDLSWMREFCRTTGRVLTFALAQSPVQPQPLRLRCHTQRRDQLCL